MIKRSYKNDLMFRFTPSFIQKVFKKISQKFGNSRKASKILKIPYPSFRGYSNGYFSSLPKPLLDKILRLNLLSKEEIERNTVLIYRRYEQNNKILDAGRKKRWKQLIKWKNEIPKLNKIFKKNYLDFERWFFFYQKLINFGARKFNYIKDKIEFLEVSYTTHSNRTKKEFILKFPKKILIDKEFIYFFGLWVGDKAGGKRFGVINKERKIISFTKEYLIKLYQNPEIVLYIAKNQSLPKNERFDKVIKINNKERGYAFSVHAINGILTSFFNYLESNLNEFLHSIKEPNLFFSGLFDAEGNVFLEDSCFRWSCKNKKLIPVFKEHLDKLNLFKRYDGINFVTYNKKVFSKKILPYLIHPSKINNSKLVCFGIGNLEERFISILNIIKNNPGITNNELAKVLKRKKCYAQVRILEKLGYIYSKNYPKQLFISKSKLLIQ